MSDAAVIPIPDRTPDSIVGGNVKYLMGDRGLEQSDLARRVGVDQSTLSLKLNGKRKWTVGELVQVSDIFGVSIDALARRRGLDPIPGGGSSLHGVGTAIRRPVGRTGLEPVTDGSWVAPVRRLADYSRERNQLGA